MTAETWYGTMAAAVARIDQLQDERDQSDLNILALVRECRRLRRQLAQRDGEIANLQSRLAAEASR